MIESSASSVHASAWSTGNAVEFYRSQRRKRTELYASETEFFGELLDGAASILDVGCAAGGFAGIVREYAPQILYSGADISPAMIAEARHRFPKNPFHLVDGTTLPFEDREFDAVVCFGVLHMTEDWSGLLEECWRVCRSSFLFDVRLVEGEGINDGALSYQKIEFGGVWDGVSTVPYLIQNVDAFISGLRGMDPQPHRIRNYGYIHPVSSMTMSPYKEVCMATFLLDKVGEPAEMEWRLPLKLKEMT